MSDFFFFTELSKLKSQDSTNKYGPVAGNLNSQFRCSSKFETTNSADELMAYAVMSGQVLLQFVQTSHDPTGVAPDTFNTTLVNVILKPTGSQNSGFPKVKYIIYRGLKVSDFLAGSLVKSETPSDSDFLKSIWEDFNDYKNDHPGNATVQSWTSPSKERMGFGLESGLTSSDSITELFNADVQNGTHHIVLHTVDPGESLGRFVAGTVCVDFIIEDRNSIIDLYSARKIESLINESVSLTGLSPGDLPPMQMAEREKILGYIDPITFYFAHYYLEIGLNEESGGTTTTTPVNNNLDTLYTNLSSKFETANQVYIDIRNEFGYSINYQKDYQGASGQTHYRKHLELGINGSSPTQENYYLNYWPIFTIDLTSNPLGAASMYEVEFSVQNLFNLNTISYADFAHNNLGTPKLHAAKFEEDTTPSFNEWSFFRSSFVPFVTDSGTKKSPAWLIKYMICRKSIPDVLTLPPGVSLPSSLFWKDNQLDNVFGPLFFEDIIKSSSKRVTFGGLGKRFIVEDDIKRIVELGVISGDMVMAFRATTIESAYTEYVEAPIQTYNISDDTEPIVKESISLRYQEIPMSYLVHDLDALSVAQEVILPIMEPVQRGVSILPEYKLIMKQTELASLRTLANTNFNTSLHDVFINLDARAELEDDNDKNYIRYNLRLSGYDNSGNYQNVAPSPVMFLLSTSDKIFNTNIPITLSNAKVFSNPNAYFSVNQLIEDVVALEEYFYTYDQVGGDSVKNMATRIRSHSYGFPGDKLNAPALNQAVPKATYEDTNPVTQGWRLKTLEPIPTEFGKDHRYYPPYQRLTARASENGLMDNLSPYINCPTAAGAAPTVNVDMGQIFYGFESLVIPYIRDIASNSSNPTDYGIGPNIDLRKYLTLYSSPSTDLADFKTRRGNPFLGSGVGPSNGTGFVEIFEIDEAFDLTAFVANIATPSAELLNTDLNAKFSGSIISAYEHSAPDVDLYGNADALGLRSAYIVIKGNSPSVKLSDVLKLYYTGTSGLIETTTNVETLTGCEYYTVSYRWLIAASYLGFVKKVNSTTYTWLPDSTVPAEQSQWNTTRDYWLRKMYIFSEFWFNKVQNTDNWIRAIANIGDMGLSIAAYYGTKKTLVNNGHDTAVIANNIQVFDTVFLPFIKNKLSTETTGITLL